MTDSGLFVLGWKERVALPDWGITRLRAKLDTGAKTSAIHVASMDEIDRYELAGVSLPRLRLVIPLSRNGAGRQVAVEAAVIGYKSVRDSGANAEQRPVVMTRLVCGPIDRMIEVTVTDRSGMIFRMILGRQALAPDVLVDPGRIYTLDGPPRTGAPSDPRKDAR